MGKREEVARVWEEEPRGLYVGGEEGGVVVVVVRSGHVCAPVRRRRQGGMVAVGWAEFRPGKGERREKRR